METRQDQIKKLRRHTVHRTGAAPLSWLFVRVMTSPNPPNKWWRIGISNDPCGPSLPPTGWRNQPYVGPKLRGRMVCLANRTASRFLRRAPQTAHAAARSIRDKRAPTGSLTRQRNRDSSSCSQQHGLYRRPPRPERQLALILLRRCTLQVRQYLRNELRLLDAGDDLQLPAAARAALDLDTEHSLQPSCPAHPHMPRRRGLDRISPRHRRPRCTPAPLRRRHRPLRRSPSPAPFL